MRESFLKKTFQAAHLNFHQGKLENAYKQFKYCISHNYELTESQFFCALYQYYKLQFHDAFIAFQKIIFSGQEHSGCYFYLGRISQDLENIEEAILFYKKAISSATNSLYPLMAYAYLQSVTSIDIIVCKEQAYQQFIIQLDISNINLILIEAFSAWGERDYILAEEKIQSILELDEHFFQAYIYLAELRMLTKHYIESEKIWNKIHQKFGLIYIGLKELIQIHFYQKSYKKAISYMKTYLNIAYYISFKDYFHLGILYYLSMNIEKAIIFFQKAFFSQPLFFSAIFNLGVCYQRLGQFKKAIDSYQKASSLEGNNAVVYYNMGLIYFEEKDYLQSLFYLNKAYHIDPSFKEAEDNFYHISYLHILSEKGFSQQNHNLIFGMFIILITVLTILTILHFIGVI